MPSRSNRLLNERFAHRCGYHPTTHRVTAKITTGMVTNPMAVDTATLAVTSSSATR